MDHPLEKIKVTALCDEALINKSTFYKYYADIYALSEMLEQEVFQKFWDGFVEKGCLITAPEKFFEGLHRQIQECLDLLVPLYKGRLHLFFEKTEATLKAYYKECVRTAEEEIQISFLIIGALHTFQSFRDDTEFSQELVQSSIVHIIENIRRSNANLSTMKEPESREEMPQA